MSHQSLPPVPPPMTNEPKPVISTHLLNPMLTQLKDNPPVVKFQVITREQQEIVVGRVKIPSPAGHAFILRRFDTGAISLTTMIRAAYPSAPEDIEKGISTWVRNNYSTAGANGPVTTQGGKNLRLAGTWIPAHIALALSTDYNLYEIIQPLVNSVPDPTGSYRKSQRGATSPVGVNQPVAMAPAGRTFLFPATGSAPPPLSSLSSTAFSSSSSPFGGPLGGVHAAASTQAPSVRPTPPASQTTPTHPNKRQRVSAPSPEVAGAANGTRSRTLAVSPLATNGPITADADEVTPPPTSLGDSSSGKHEDAAEMDEVSQNSLFPTIEEDRAENTRLLASLSAQAPTYAAAPIQDDEPATKEVVASPSAKKTGGRKAKGGKKRAIEEVTPEVLTTFEPVEHSWDTGTEVQRVIASSRRAEAAKAGALTKLTSAIPVPATPDGRKLFWGGLMMATGFAAAAFSSGVPQLFF